MHPLPLTHVRGGQSFVIGSLMGGAPPAVAPRI